LILTYVNGVVTFSDPNYVYWYYKKIIIKKGGYLTSFLIYWYLYKNYK
jgi:hypothetical protein